MSDPYQQYTHPHPPYMQQPSPSGPPPPPLSESEAAYYAPPDSLYQHPPYDYETQYPYAQHIAPDQYGSHYDVSQTPRYQPPVSPPLQGSQSDHFLGPASSAEYRLQECYASGRLSPKYKSWGEQGSNADYYSQHPAENDTQQGTSPHLSQQSDARELRGGADDSGDERNVGGALLGGATGLYLGHKKGHGILGAVGGALLGNFIGDRLEEHGGKEEHHGGRHGHGHRHGRRRHRHHHHGHGHSHSHSHGHSHGHSHHRSRSRHDTSSGYSGSS
ncbi:hypothetical protein BDW42DRAFT_162954 [Aspergillus taichungensis]|uniref:Glycine zipper 2TM domain-containing protein n=1 Tax=Aspergillus taichungensis TaxID=482145 RepID=A0A2J5I3H2_9EURO|nr:hypothetical protein BDW42DRAFT_162954 [Aspergillus taichungensis]